jgi:hypothetical protein
MVLIPSGVGGPAVGEIPRIVELGDDSGRLGIAAANVNDAEVVRFLISRGADPGRRSAAEGVANPLFGAARNGNVELIRTLLERKVDVNAASADYGPKVTNGLIQFGRITPLHMAVVSGEPEAVRLLLDAGATADAADIRGMTPLMFAVATDRPQPRIIQMLLDAGASTTLRSKADETALDWARKFNNPAVLAEFGMVSLTTQRPNSAAAGGPRPVSTTTLSSREAVERSLPLLRSSSARMMSNGGCVACHAQPLTGLAIGAARVQGWTSEGATRETGEIAATTTAATPEIMLLRDAGGRPDSWLYSLLFLATDGAPPNRTTDAMVRFVAAKQRKDGTWRGMGGTRAPMQDGDVSRTALAIRALTAYATPAYRNEYAQRVTRAAGWLAKQTPVSTEQRVMQLLGLHWADAAAKVRQAGVRELLAEQRPDGGWGQTPYLGSDAYATGQALYTLRELGVPAADAALQRGAAFLRRTQAPDGSWHVTNRAMKVQPYFDGGFPYDHDQWISQAATAWAVIGLARTDMMQAPDLVATTER